MDTQALNPSLRSVHAHCVDEEMKEGGREEGNSECVVTDVPTAHSVLSSSNELIATHPATDAGQVSFQL